jgi:hypothetical protein
MCHLPLTARSVASLRKVKASKVCKLNSLFVVNSITMQQGVVGKSNDSSSNIVSSSSIDAFHLGEVAATHIPFHGSCGGSKHEHFANVPIPQCVQDADSNVHLLRNEAMDNPFDCLYMATLYPSLDQEQEIHIVSIFGHMPELQNDSENPVRRFTNGAPNKSLDPTSIPPPNRFVRTRSCVSV